METRRKQAQRAVQPKLRSASQSYTSGASSSSSMTIIGMFSKTNITTARIERLTGLIANMIAKDTLPISFVDGTGFKELMAYTLMAWIRCTMCENHQETTAVRV
jgi:ethanolamine utilization protein EutP (predicted NTPase)